MFRHKRKSVDWNLVPWWEIMNMQPHQAAQVPYLYFERALNQALDYFHNDKPISTDHEGHALHIH